MQRIWQEMKRHFDVAVYEPVCGSKTDGDAFTLHAGECGSVQNILDAVQCGASRVGHGIALRGQKEAIRICRDRHIGIEMCPLSNMQTKAVKDPADYPIQEFLRENLLVTINTDNRMVRPDNAGKRVCVSQRTVCSDQRTRSADDKKCQLRWRLRLMK